jgi:hypothetical protein
MKRKKILLPILIVIILILVLFTGCTSLRYFPVETLEPDVSWDFERVHLRGYIAVPFCKARGHKFVYDTESHENWEDYQYKISGEVYSPSSRRFDAGLSTRDLEHEVTYYVRAVAYCYDFKRPFKNFEEGHYTGGEETFYINW